MNNNIFLIALAVCIVLFVYIYVIKDPNPFVLVKGVLDRHIAEMKANDYDLKMIGGSLIYDSNIQAVGFRSKDAPSLEDSRVLYVRAVELLLSQINRDETIKPYLKNYPFQAENINYTMSFKRCAKKMNAVSYIFLHKGEVVYAAIDEEHEDDSDYSLKVIHEEPYSEALRIVREAGLLETSPDK